MRSNRSEGCLPRKFLLGRPAPTKPLLHPSFLPHPRPHCGLLSARDNVFWNLNGESSRTRTAECKAHSTPDATSMRCLPSPENKGKRVGPVSCIGPCIISYQCFWEGTTCRTCHDLNIPCTQDRPRRRRGPLNRYDASSTYFSPYADKSQVTLRRRNGSLALIPPSAHRSSLLLSIRLYPVR